MQVYRDLLYDYGIQNKSGQKLLSHLSELSSHLILRPADEDIALKDAEIQSYKDLNVISLSL